MSSLHMENIEMKIKIKQLELENKELKKELEKLLKLHKPSVKEVMNKESNTSKTLGSGRKRDKEILMALSINNGLNRDEIIELFFANTKNAVSCCNTVMKRLDRDGHVKVDRTTQPFKYFSKHQFKKPNYEGHIYFIKEFHSNTFKIGKSKNIEERLRMFNVKLPFEWELIHTIKVDDYSLAEKLIHKMFKDKRIKGTEWFDLNEEDIKLIQSNSFTPEVKSHILSSSQEEKTA